MILTGKQIERERTAGHITLSPFDRAQLNPNSYNYRLGRTLKLPRDKHVERTTFAPTEIPDAGFVLWPGQMVLGHTLERIGSTRYAMSLIGRSSLGRLGLFLQVSANLGHSTSDHAWTLELVAAQPIRLYAGMPVGQVSFWANDGEIQCLGKHYANYSAPMEPLSS